MRDVLLSHRCGCCGSLLPKVRKWGRESVQKVSSEGVGRCLICSGLSCAGGRGVDNHHEAMKIVEKSLGKMMCG